MEKSPFIGFGEPHYHFEVCASTNAIAMDLAKQGALEGTLVTADFQTQGRGRLGRRWMAAKGENLLFSVVLRPVLPPEKWGLLTLVAAIAVAESVEYQLAERYQGQNASFLTQIKWSNDVLLNRKKICGMLLESSMGQDPVVILGIGINVNQTLFDDELARKATSIALITEKEWPIAPFLVHILSTFQRYYIALQKGMEQGIFKAYLSYLVGLNESIHLHQFNTNTMIEGIIRGIEPTGALVLELPDGTQKSFHSGEVSLSHWYS